MTVASMKQSSILQGVAQKGSVLQVVSAFKDDVFSMTGTTLVDITGLSVAITPSSSSSKMLVLVASVLGNSEVKVTSLGLLRNTTLIAPGSGGASSRSYDAFLDQETDASHIPAVFSFLDSPGSGAEITYKVQMRVSGGTGYVNRRGTSSTLGANSSLTVMEVAG